MATDLRNVTLLERRFVMDRRDSLTPGINRYLATGRRAQIRREDDQAGQYRLDRYHYKYLLIILATVMLSVTDAFLTLFLINQGAEEINPIMAFSLGYGNQAFFWSKYLLTCLPLLFVLFNANIYLFRTSIRTKVLFIFSLTSFLLVINWELYLIYF